MKLAAEHFAEIFESLGKSTGTAVAHDKRRAVRHEYSASIRITPCSAGQEELTVPLVNFSTRGLCIAHTEQFPLGSQFVALMPRKGKLPASILCTNDDTAATITSIGRGHIFLK